jgi:hypothetical protein
MSISKQQLMVVGPPIHINGCAASPPMNATDPTSPTSRSRRVLNEPVQIL